VGGGVVLALVKKDFPPDMGDSFRPLTPSLSPKGRGMG